MPSLVNYAGLKPFLTWWVGFHGGGLDTPEKLAESLAVHRAGYLEMECWNPHLMAFRRLRQDARVRMAKRFLREAGR